jgi:UDP-MurNAc hydroxylase
MSKSFLLQFIGHAGFVIQQNGVSLVCDPWFSKTGAFMASWHQFPPNDFVDLQTVYNADYLYISHEHDDHFDEDFLETFPKEKTLVIIADFLSDSLARKVAALGFPRIVKLRDFQDYRLADNFSVCIFRDQTLYKAYSVLLIKADGVTILNKNDCHIQDQHFPLFKTREIDLLLAQFSGAMWYPAAYEYDAKKEREIVAGIRKDLLNGFVEFANRIGAKHVAHCAGPACFLENQAFRLNFKENSIFYDQHDVWPELSERIKGNLHVVLPGDTLKFGEEGELQVTRSRDFDFSRKKDFLLQYKGQRGPLIKAYLDSLPRPEEGFREQFLAYISHLFAANSWLQSKVNALVAFRILGPHGGSVYVDTRDNRFTVCSRSEERPNYVFYLEGPIAKVLVDGEKTWEEVLLSLRFRAKRDPDVYNWPLFAILRYGHEPQLLAQIEQLMRERENESIVVYDGNKAYRIQRHCPHAGEDLTYATVQEGKLVCRRHHWTFDLRTGGICMRGGNVSLKIYEVLEKEEKEGSYD